jgi:adenylate kinase
MARLFLVFGTHGAGKTTVLRGLRSAKIVNMGGELFRLYSKEFGITSRDQIHAKSLSNYAYMVKARNHIIRRISKAAGPVVIDTHAADKRGDGYAVGLSFSDLNVMKGKARAIIYIDASNAQILKRRQKDAAVRKRERDTDEGLSMDRNISLTFVALFSLYLEVPIYIVQNEDGRLKETQLRIEEIIRNTK